MINLHKSEINDQNRKDVKVWSWCFSLTGVKLYKIKSYKVI